MKLEEVLFEVTSNNLIQIRIEGKIKLWNLSHWTNVKYLDTK